MKKKKGKKVVVPTTLTKADRELGRIKTTLAKLTAGFDTKQLKRKKTIKRRRNLPTPPTDDDDQHVDRD